MPSDPRTPAAVVNRSGEEIPAGGVMEPDGTADAEGRVGVRKPTRDDSAAVLFNGPDPIPAFADEDEEVPGTGTGYSPYPFARFAPHADDLPYDVTEVGTKAGDWHMRVGRGGFLLVTPVVGGYAVAMVGAPLFAFDTIDVDQSVAAACVDGQWQITETKATVLKGVRGSGGSGGDSGGGGDGGDDDEGGYGPPNPPF